MTRAVRIPFSIAALLLMAPIVPSVLLAHEAPNIISFDAPGAGSAAGQGTGCFGCTFGLNQLGQVAGTYLDANDVYHGFIRYSDGKYVSFEVPAADTTPGSNNGTVAQNINDAGVITGYFANTTGVPQGYVRTAEGKFTTFNVPGAVNGTFPISINLEGSIVGYALDAGFLFHAFLRSPDGKITTYVGPGSCNSGTSAGCFGSEATNAELNGSSSAASRTTAATLSAMGCCVVPAAN